MDFSLEQACPQCGGQIELDEADRLIHCPYCQVKHFLFSPDYFRYYLPPTSPVRNVFYAPYMRFKGVAYFCAGTSINHRFVDLTLQGTASKHLPLSLGVRPQALRMKFISPELEGPFLRNTLSTDDMFNYVGHRRSVSGEEELLLRAYVGEAVSCIYLPLYRERHRLFDAISHEFVSDVTGEEEALFSGLDESPEWKTIFMATLCPHCGWDLQGERDSIVLTCSNCDRIWKASRSTFTEVDFNVVAGQGSGTVYLPFWRMVVEDHTLPIKTYGDFVRVIENPVLFHHEAWDDEMSFWIPAFKIRPEVFLRLAGQMTLFQKDFRLEQKGLPEHLYPVTLLQKEAVQVLAITLANMAWNAKRLFPLLPHIDFQVKYSSLVYLPFDDTGQELIQQQKRISVYKNTMKAGRNL